MGDSLGNLRRGSFRRLVTAGVMHVHHPTASFHRLAKYHHKRAANAILRVQWAAQGHVEVQAGSVWPADERE